NLILEYQDELNYSIKRYKELINNSKLDVHLRRLEILKIFDKTVNKNNVPLSIITEPKIKFDLSLMDINTNLINKIFIEDCDQPNPPFNLTIDKLSNDSCYISWEMIDILSNNDNYKPILEFQIELLALPKTERIPEKDNNQLKNNKEKEKSSK